MEYGFFVENITIVKLFKINVDLDIPLEMTFCI